ncbi:hypothetical protein Tco_1136241, partial [Tanacetum coccineum]
VSYEEIEGVGYKALKGFLRRFCKISTQDNRTHHCDGVNEVTNQSLKGWEDPGVKAMQGLDTDATFAGESFDVNNAIKEKRSFVIVDAIYWFSS